MPIRSTAYAVFYGSSLCATADAAVSSITWRTPGLPPHIRHRRYRPGLATDYPRPYSIELQCAYLGQVRRVPAGDWNTPQQLLSSVLLASSVDLSPASDGQWLRAWGLGWRI